MRRIRRSIALLLLPLALLGAALPAQEEGADPGEAADAAETPREGGEADARETPGEDGLSGPGEEDVFVPTEELDADEEVTFPVDI